MQLQCQFRRSALQAKLRGVGLADIGTGTLTADFAALGRSQLSQ